MTDIIFDGSTLKWGTDSLQAVSGGFGKKAPAGLYSVERRNITTLSTKIGKGFRDKATGEGFFVPIEPLFGGHGRDGLGIHPDGNNPGTLGCIGISSGSTSFFNKMKSLSPSAKLQLEVKY